MTLLDNLFLLMLLVLVHELLEHIVCLPVLESSLSHVIFKLSKERDHANSSRYVGSLKSLAERISFKKCIEESTVVRGN